jgi:hypothetical protein
LLGSIEGTVASSRPAATTTVATGRGKDRQRRPAAAGAQRPCGSPPLRPHSLKEEPVPDRLNNLLGNDS